MRASLSLMMRCSAGLILWLLLTVGVQAQCRQALAMGLDVSGSVDDAEYRLQLDGLAAALVHPEVRSSLLATPGAPVQITVYEWSSPEAQTVLVPWRAMRSEADIQLLAKLLQNTQRDRSGPPGTALGTAMLTGMALLQERAECWKLTLDISGDGKRNMGPRPQEVKAQLEAANITVNALVIGADAPRIGDVRQVEIAELSSYFRTNVILGQDAFVQTALGFRAYEEAMVQKLKRELETLIVSYLR